MTYKIAFRVMFVFVTAALLCVGMGCGNPGGGDADRGGEVDAYLGTFNPMLEIEITPDKSAGKISTSISPRDDGTYRYGDTVIVTAEPNRFYTFNGWSGILMDTVQIIMDGNKTLTANFIRTYVVTFDANGGEGTPPKKQTVPAGSDITLPTGNDLKKANGSFSGWEHKSSGVTYPAGATFIVKGDETLYAKWGDEYTVTFHANGGDGTPPKTQTIPAGSDLTVPDSGGLYYDGYAFDGWSVSSNDGKYYGAGGTYTPTKSVTMYARWVRVYAVKFNTEGGGAVDDMRVRSGTIITLPKPDNRSSYVFNGWTDDHSHGTHQVGDSYLVKDNTIMSANWSRVYTVAFDRNGGIGATPASYTAASGTLITLPLLDAERPEYDFVGWNTDINGAGDRYKVGQAYRVTGDAILYADWEESQTP